MQGIKQADHKRRVLAYLPPNTCTSTGSINTHTERQREGQRRERTVQRGEREGETQRKREERREERETQKEAEKGEREERQRVEAEQSRGGGAHARRGSRSPEVAGEAAL